MTRVNRTAATLRRRVRAWHRRIGLVASVLVLAVVATGLLLNHVEKLGLDQSIVANEALLGWYGREPQGEPIAYRVGANWLTWLKGSLYLNYRHLAETAASVKGAVAVKNFVVVAAPEGLLAFTNDGTVIEKISGIGLPGPIEAIGLSGDDRVVLRTRAGQFSATVDFLDWTPGAAPVDWVRPDPLPPEIKAAILKSYRGGGVPWSRFLLDIHTGRILGAWGPYLVDAAALSLLILVGTGIYNWLGRTR